MEKISDLIRSMHTVYDVFASELQNNLEQLRRTVSRLDQAKDDGDLRIILDELSKELENDFHVMKGGAGFLQLMDIEANATAGENWCKNLSERKETNSTLKEEFSLLVAELGENTEKVLKLIEEVKNT